MWRYISDKAIGNFVTSCFQVVSDHEECNYWRSVLIEWPRDLQIFHPKLARMYECVVRQVGRHPSLSRVVVDRVIGGLVKFAGINQNWLADQSQTCNYRFVHFSLVLSRFFGRVRKISMLRKIHRSSSWNEMKRIIGFLFRPPENENLILGKIKNRVWKECCRQSGRSE